MNTYRFNDARFAAGPVVAAYVVPRHHRTGVAQPPGTGADYPFLAKDPLSPLVADFYLSYEDDTCGFEPPFRLAYLHGFGANAGAVPAGMPRPRNALDLVVVDAAGYVVFDSTVAALATTPWGDSRAVAQWEAGQQVARVVYHTDAAPAFAADQAADSPLDPRTCDRLPRRVRSIRVGLDSFSGPVSLSAGYNVALSAAADAGADGGRLSGTISLDGIPGAGIGRAPGCELVLPVVRRINQVPPDQGGAFVLQLDDCFRAQLPLTTRGGVSTFGDSSLRGATARHAIEIHSDCRPCCECDYYARTYRGLSRTWDRWAATAAAAEAVRDAFAANRGRWLSQLACRVANPIRVVVNQEPRCGAFAGAVYCNTSQCCLPGLEIRFTLQSYTAGVLDTAPPASTSVVEAYIQSSGTGGEVAYAPALHARPDGAPVVSFDLGFADPQTSAVAKLRVCTTCDATKSLKVTATAHAPDPPPARQSGAACVLPTPAVPADLAAIWSSAGVPSSPMRAIASRTVGLTPASPSFRCDC